MAPQNQQIANRGGQALAARPAPVDGLITSAQDLVAQIEKAQREFNILSPVTSTSKLADGYAAAMSVVTIDTDEANGADVYSDRLMNGKVALTKISLMRLCAALGISWVETTRLDNGLERFYWNVQVRGEYRAADGTLQTIIASKEVDFRDGSTQIGGKSTAEVSRMRQHGQQLAETKAQLRAVRTLGVRSQYTKQELAKPFLVVRFSFVPDMSDPDVRKMVTAAHLGITSALYPGATGSNAPALPAGEGPLPKELGGGTASAPKQVGAGRSASAPAAAAPPAEAEFDDTEGELDDTPRHRVDRVLQKNEAGDFAIILADGRTLLTADETMARTAAAAKKQGHAVIVTVVNGRVEELVALNEPAPTGTPAQAADEAQPVDDGQRRVQDVKPNVKSGKNDRGPWSLSFIVLSTGEEVSTFSSTDVAIAQEARAKGWAVSVEIDDSDPERPRLKSIALIDPAQGSLLSGEAKY